jgi:hypothetical protein
MFWDQGGLFLESPGTLIRPGRLVVGDLADRAAHLTQVGPAIRGWLGRTLEIRWSLFTLLILKVHNSPGTKQLHFP